MNRTWTPEVDPEVLERLEGYGARLRPGFNHSRQPLWCEAYLRGLLLEGERKSLEPLSGRVSLPAALGPVADPEQALRQFVNQSRWEEATVARHYRAAMAEVLAEPDGVFLIDDPTFPKAGRHSVGVQRQYCGALGKKANGQCAVSVHYAASQGHVPLAMRLFLPTTWQEDSARLDRAGVPEAARRALSKGEIALELLDQIDRLPVAFSNIGHEKALMGGEAFCRTRKAGNTQAARHEIRVTPLEYPRIPVRPTGDLAEHPQSSRSALARTMAGRSLDGERSQQGNATSTTHPVEGATTRRPPPVGSNPRPARAHSGSPCHARARRALRQGS